MDVPMTYGFSVKRPEAFHHHIIEKVSVKLICCSVNYQKLMGVYPFVDTKFVDNEIVLFDGKRHNLGDGITYNKFLEMVKELSVHGHREFGESPLTMEWEIDGSGVLYVHGGESLLIPYAHKTDYYFG